MIVIPISGASPEEEDLSLFLEVNYGDPYLWSYQGKIEDSLLIEAELC